MHSHSVAHLQEDKLLDDPWSLTLPEREELLATRSDSQAKWMNLLPDLVEPPTPEPSFPAFLLDTEPFARLREAIGEAQSQRGLEIREPLLHASPRDQRASANLEQVRACRALGGDLVRAGRSHLSTL